MAITVDFGNCEQCGTKNSHYLSKCHACGSELPWAAPPAPPDSSTPTGGVGPGTNKGFCPHCGAPTVGLVNFCASCGKSVFSSAGRRASNRSSYSSSYSTGGCSGGLFLFFGALMLLGGLLGACYFMFVFDTSVAVPTSEVFGVTVGGGRVNNLGLMADRQNGLIFSMGAAVIGLILMVVGRALD